MALRPEDQRLPTDGIALVEGVSQRLSSIPPQQESISAVVLAELRFGIQAAAPDRRQRQSAGPECFSGHGGGARLAWRSCRSLRAAARRTQGPVNSCHCQRSADRLPCPPAGVGLVTQNLL